MEREIVKIGSVELYEDEAINMMYAMIQIDKDKSK